MHWRCARSDNIDCAYCSPSLIPYLNPIAAPTLSPTSPSPKTMICNTVESLHLCVTFQHTDALASVVRSLTSLAEKDSTLDALEEVVW